MDDDGGFSFDDVPEETPAVEAAVGGDAPAAADGSGDATATAAGAPEAAAEEIVTRKKPVLEDDTYRRPVTLYRHWVRYVFLF